MSEVVLLYDSGCPNVSNCRANLVKAFAASGKKPTWREIDRSLDDAPQHLRGYGSPTILVDGFDVAGQLPDDRGATCRLYRSDDGEYMGVPSVDQIAESLSGGLRKDVPLVPQNNAGSWNQTITVLPVAAALLPTITCPACWPGYAALLSSLGIGFLASNQYLLPLTATFLVVYALLLVWDARRHRRLGPLIVGLVGSTALFFGRFTLASDALLYSGITALLTASIWNTWPSMRQRWRTANDCSACGSKVKVHSKGLTPEIGTGRKL